MRNQRNRFVFVTILGFVLGAPGIANADPIRIDQISPIGGSGLGCCLGEDWAQTFTVGITGVLRTVALPLSRPDFFLDDDFSGQLGVQLRPTLGGIPGDSVLAEMILSKSSLPALSAPGVRFEFTTFFSGLNIPIVEGAQLAIVLSNVGHNGQNIRWALNESGSYARGAPYRQAREDNGMTGDRGNVIGPWRPGSPEDGDFAFLTSVEPAAMSTPTPEPASLLLLGSGIVGILASRRRRTLFPHASESNHEHAEQLWAEFHRTPSHASASSATSANLRRV